MMNLAKYMMEIIISIFMLLGASMFLVGKYCKEKILKISLNSIIILITLYCVMLSIDINKINSLREPIFARENRYMGSMTRYDGLGYKIGLEKDASTGNILQSQMTMFGSIIAAAITNKEDKSGKDSLQSIFIDKDYDCNKAFEESYYAKLYYTDSNNIKYYTVCLNEITLKYNNKEISLKEALENNPTIMDEITSKLTKTDILMDGGTAIYKEFGYSNFAYSEMGNTAFTVIKCNAMQNIEFINGQATGPEYNKDYYFGDGSFDYEEGYCR